MPEGHTIHRLARDQGRDLLGAPVAASAGQDRFESGVARLDGQVVTKVEAWGKHLFHHFESADILHVHLGLIGKWFRRVADNGWDLPLVTPGNRLRLAVDQGDGAVAWDLSGPMTCEVVGPDERDAAVAALGPDPLRRNADPERMWAKLQRSAKPVGLTIMDQAVVAGIGNVYRSELLNIVGVDPRRPARRLTREEFDALWAEMVRQLRLGVRRNKIVTMSTDELPRPIGRLRKGEGRYAYKQEHCGRCHTPLDIYPLGGRHHLVLPHLPAPLTHDGRSGVREPPQRWLTYASWARRGKAGPMLVADIPTPALVVDLDAFDANVARMATRWPGASLRPHVKAFKSTALARRLADAGHTAFCAATVREVAGLADAGLGDDILLANEVVDGVRLRAVLAEAGDARITVAVDSTETIEVAAASGVREVLVDVDVGMPRCGCAPADADRLAEQALAVGLVVRGVMGYEGHLMAEPTDRAAKVEAAMAILAEAHARVGGDVVSGGGTGTWDVNHWITELQAGSYLLMDTHYEAAGVGFAKALSLHLTVLSRNGTGGWAVADGGLKALGMDHGDPSIDGATVWFCSDEHLTFSMREGTELPAVGERVRVWPAHVDPTVAYHEVLWVARGDEVVDRWPVDLRGW